MKIVERAKWLALPPASRTTWDPKSLKGVVLHWFGVPKAASSHRNCPALLRSVQRSHMAGEFSDIAYNHGVCPHGAIYELRGFWNQTGANGTRAANREYASVVYMAGVGDPLTEDAKKALADIIAQWQRKGIGKTVLPHGHFTGSECPGPEVRAWIKSGLKVKAAAVARKAFRLVYRHGIPYTEPCK